MPKACAAIPTIKTLQDPLRGEVGAAFAGSMSIIWKTMIGVAGLGLLTVALMEEVPMRTVTGERYGLHDTSRDSKHDEETGGMTPVDEKIVLEGVLVEELKG